MARKVTTVELDDDQLHELERLAARASTPVDELVRQAVRHYLIAQEDNWGARFDALSEKIRAGMHAGMSSDDIEADISAAAAEARAIRVNRRLTQDGGASAPRR